MSENLFPHENKTGGNPQNKSDYKLVKDIMRALKQEQPANITAENTKAIWDSIYAQTIGEKHRILRKKRRAYISIAASLIFFLAAIGLFLNFNNTKTSIVEIAEANHKLLNSSENISLSLHNRQELMVEDDKLDLSHLHYEASSNIIENDIQYNTLTVPYGKRIEVLLPDSSVVWLNSGSQLTFPLVFSSKKREVYLEGEGYFDIKTENIPFYVYTTDIQIEVLGTTFNVSSYKEDSFTSTALLSGSIILSGRGDVSFPTQMLQPGNMAKLIRSEKKLSIDKENVADHVAWKEKQLILQNTPLSDLLVRLGRIYNTEIITEDRSLERETFSGRLDMTQSLEKLLTTIYGHQHQFINHEKERRLTIKKL